MLGEQILKERDEMSEIIEAFSEITYKRKFQLIASQLLNNQMKSLFA